MVMIDYTKLMEIGLKKHTAQNIIKEAKIKLVQKGYEFYGNKSCGHVPVKEIEEILGINFTQQEGEVIGDN